MFRCRFARTAIAVSLAKGHGFALSETARS